VTRSVLILSPHFPPSMLAGVHRARHLARHLPVHGWRPIVVRAHERCYVEPGDPDLAALVPANLEQVRTGALPARLCRLAGVGDIGLRAWPYLRRAIDRLIVTEQPSAVLITGSPFYPMLLTRGITRRFGVPVVLDFQDPWVAHQGAAYAVGTKAWAAHSLAVALEPSAVRHAAFVTSVSDVQNEDMSSRYPWLDRERTAAIPIGVDPDDFAALRDRSVAVGETQFDPALVNFNYIGSYWPRAAPSICRVFTALALLRKESPSLASRLRLNFVGTDPTPGSAGVRKVLPLAVAAGVGDLVSEFPQRLPYLQALGLLAHSDVLLLIGSDEPHYTASKIYPALMSGRPYLSLFHQASSAHKVLVAAGGGCAIAFRDAGHLDGSIPALVEALRALAISPAAFGYPSLEAIEPYTARTVAGQFAEVFDRVSRP